MTDVAYSGESKNTVPTTVFQRYADGFGEASVPENDQDSAECLSNEENPRQVNVETATAENIELPDGEVSQESKVENETENNDSQHESRNENFFTPDGKWKDDETENESESAFTSILSLFQTLKSGGGNEKHIKNNESSVDEISSPVPYQNNFFHDGLGCCLFGTPNEGKETCKENDVHSPFNNMTVVSTSPKPENVLSPCSNVTSEGASGVVSEQVSPIRSISQEESSYNAGLPSFVISNIPRSPNVNSRKLNLISEGDISVCFQYHSKSIFSKVLTLKFLRRWETHHIYLKEDSISSKTPNGLLEFPLSYSNIEDVYGVGKGEQGNKLYLRLACGEGSIIMQASNSFTRDQWLSTIIWKKKMHNCRSILQSSSRPEVILKEIKSLIMSIQDSPFQDDSIVTVPVEIISNVLMQREIWQECKRREEVITALIPLLERATPSPDMFQFFSEHCFLHPRSRIVLDVFTSVVHRILKRTFDFGKSTYMRKFAADYMAALYSQNGGDEAITKFILSLHGPNSECPHPRVLKNLVAVNLAAILSIFEQKRVLVNESANEENCSHALQQLDCHLKCHITVFRAISEYGDWRPGLAQLLQPIPFPDDALSHEFFMDGFTPVIKSIGTDTRCEVHEMILGVREGKGGWLNVYCPSGLVCRDEGELWCHMLETLISCCCRRKSFLQQMMKHLGALILVALRGHNVAQEILCLMLEWHIIYGEDQELQVVTALESTETGREKYTELCKRQEHLRELQKKRGPRKLTLPSRSTDVDVAQLLSSGSFGNLECLSLAFTHVTSSCAHQLIQLPTLRCLNLWATHFGDAGLIVIAEHLDKLQVLNLCETPVTDKGISALVGMKSLKKLNLNSTKLSPQTLETLKRKLPALQELDVRYTDAW